MNYLFIKSVARDEDGWAGLAKRQTYNPEQEKLSAAAADEPEEQKKCYDIALTVYTLTETDFLFVKRIHVLDEVDGLMEKIKGSSAEARKIIQEIEEEEGDWLWRFAAMDYKFMINDNMDIIA
jgi:hypothetical protein